MRSLLALFLLASSPPAWASFEDMGFGARSIAMGDAMTAVPDELASAALNPAALGQLRRPQLELGLRRLSQVPAGPKDLNGVAVGYGLPLGPPLGGALAVTWAQDGNAEIALERAVGLSYGTRSWRELGAGILDIGASVKQLKRSGRSLGGSISRAVLDLGAFFRMGEEQSLGFSLVNLNSPRMDLAGVPDRAPRAFRAGYARKARQFIFAMDLAQREPSAGFKAGPSLSAGAEREWSHSRYGSLAARTGVHAGRVARTWSLGGGWRVLGVQFDYALRIPLAGGSRWSHAVSLSYRFGAWNPETEYEKLLSRELRYREDLSRALDESEAKQRRLGAEVRLLRAELEGMRRELGERREQAGDLQKQLRLKEMEEKRRKAEMALEELEAERERLRSENHGQLYREDWARYQDLKAQNAPHAVLVDRMRQILRQYQGTGVDLGEANQELQRLLRE